MWLRSAVALKRFLRREAGAVYLVCTSKRNWYDFIQNNIIPVLPDNVKVVWAKPVQNEVYRELQSFLHQSNLWSIPKPFFVAVTSHALYAISLNRKLQELKPKAKSSNETKLTCKVIIDASLEKLQKAT